MRFYASFIVLILALITWIHYYETNPFLSPLGDPDTIYVYFNGSFNSTFRIYELAHEGISVTPVYINDPIFNKNQSIPIVEGRKKYPSIKDVVIINRVALTYEVLNAMNDLYDITQVDRYYGAMAELSLHYNQYIEQCNVSDKSAMVSIVRPYIVDVHDNDREYTNEEMGDMALSYHVQKMTLPVQDSSIDIFKMLVFPLIYRTKDMLLQHATSRGFLDLLPK